MSREAYDISANGHLSEYQANQIDSYLRGWGLRTEVAVIPTDTIPGHETVKEAYSLKEASEETPQTEVE